MKASFENIDSVFEFKGSWGIPSKCGLKRTTYNGKDVILVSELYKDNPGTAITQVTASLAMQICEKLNIDPKNLIYIEHNPEMGSKLSFYDEVFYSVSFEIVNGEFCKPAWKLLTTDEIKKYLK
ncbi:MAG TPA: hypothetical protein PLR88_05540 [Bacteroidales bacterium]|nr:hypothetical protein [Bacteroidales bacterium]